MIIISSYKLKTFVFIVNTIGTIDDLIEKNNLINKQILKLISIKYDSIKMKPHTEKLEKFAFFQEGPGIRNWQYVDDGIKFINIRCINDGNIYLDSANMISKTEAYGIYKHFLVQEKDILLSTSGTIGRVSIARKNHLPLCMNTSVIRFRPNKNENYPYLFCYLVSADFKNLIISMSSGSAQLNFGPTHLKQIRVALPNESELQKFNSFAQPLIDKYIELMDKNDKLKKSKELLLSKYF